MNNCDDRLTLDGINKYIKNELHPIVLDNVDSTNEEVKRRAVSGAPEGLLVISNRQSAGKGRRGRSFYSPDGTGIYMSVLFRPDAVAVDDTMLITTQAAVAVSRAVSRICHRETAIKWVNDIYLNDRKICGILAEAVADPKNGGIDCIVVGIGVNVRAPKEMPDELKKIMGYIYDADAPSCDLNEIAAGIADELFLLYKSLPDRGFLVEYKSRSNVLGKRILYGNPGLSRSIEEHISDGTMEEGVAEDIGESGGLVIRKDDGSLITIQSGEVSIRTK